MGYAITSGGYGRNAGKRWRGDDIAELRRLARRQTPLRAISLKLGRPDAAILTKARSLGLHVNEEPVQPRLPMPPRRRLSPASSPMRPRMEPRGEQLELF
ncbi:hypothetical protein FKB34_10800 [Glycocaulis profundi]|nr:hypothetical protein FKB34_10800 [Glycocaulis profundi]